MLLEFGPNAAGDVWEGVRIVAIEMLIPALC